MTETDAILTAIKAALGKPCPACDGSGWFVVTVQHSARRFERNRCAICNPASDPPCAHTWGRRPSDPSTPRCQECGVPFDQATHDPIMPDVDPPVRSFDDLELALREQREAA